MSEQYSLIALHGNGGGGFRFALARAHYPATVNFVTPTLAGFAGVPKDPSLRTLSDYARAFHQVVMQQPTPRVVLGTGIGGSIVLEMLQHHADDVAGVILHAPVGTRLDTRLFPRLMRLPLMRGVGQWVFSASLFRPMWQRLLFQSPVDDDYAKQFFDEYARCTVFGQMFDIITPQWFQTLKPLHVPAVLLWGAREKILRVEQLEDYKALLPQHSVAVIEDWDHFPMIETPQQFAEVTHTLAQNLLQGHM